MKNKWNYIISGVMVIFLTYIVVKDRRENLEPKSIKEFKEDSCLVPKLLVDEKILNKIDSVDVDYMKLKKEKKEHLKTEKRIHDSIKLVKQKFNEEQKKLQEEKKSLKERYEKQIDNIYKYNNVTRGGPEDTLKSEKD
jgi:hypothetical protein